MLLKRSKCSASEGFPHKNSSRTFILFVHLNEFELQKFVHFTHIFGPNIPLIECEHFGVLDNINYDNFLINN